ncbi:MAG: di-heme-cytochrome C peroxidase [Gammaproteobacteria bacterium]|nr:di-heme-cytochrome C peroxidase [Gammaproteobacteria bacterium]
MSTGKTIRYCALALVGASVALSTTAADRYTDLKYYGGGVIALDQGWGAEDRDRFYHEPQGSPIMPYEWFLQLEQPNSNKLFRDNEYMRSFGMITTTKPSKRNPDALPVGLTKDLGIHAVEPKLGMNCGACHVSEVTYEGKTVLIDGGASHFDFWRFITALEAALKATYDDDAKFERFAAAILDDDNTAERRRQLHARLRGVLEKRQDWAFRNKANVEPGPGRVDALNVILNEVTAMMLDRPDNARPSDAPVSYPFVWDTPYLDYVQYNAVVPNADAGAMGRNVGQVLGVFGEVSIIKSTLPPGYPSSVRMDHLVTLEQTMETLTSPTWEEMANKGVLPELDDDLVEQGSRIYANECAACHKQIDRTDRGDLASIPVTKVPWDEIGTDPATTLDFGKREVATGPLYGRKADFVEGEPLCRRTHADQLLAHMTVGAMLHQLDATGASIAKSVEKGVIAGAMDAIRGFFSFSSEDTDKPTETDQQVISRMSQQGYSEEEITKALESRSGDKAALYSQLVEDGLDRHGENRACLEVLESAVYRARPLNGIWATGPFLHNGSVPTLHDMLLPPEERPDTFFAGSREIDPEKVGFVNDEGPRTMKFDTSIDGNSNAGHTHGTSLSESERNALLEYLKSL